VVTIGSTEYSLPKGLLCKQSKFFSRAFEGDFKEGKEQRVALSEEIGVVSNRGFQCIIQWLLVGWVNFGQGPSEQGVTDALELARLADMLEIFGVESLAADRIEIIIKSYKESPVPPPDFGRNTSFINHEHVASGVYLPVGHPIRHVLARAAVEGMLQLEDHKFVKEIEKLPDFALDVFREVQTTLRDFTSDRRGIYFKDPIRGDRVPFKPKRRGSIDSLFSEDHVIYPLPHLGTS